MPEIIRCGECDRETYMGIAACPHCGADMAPTLVAAETSTVASGGAAGAATAMVVVRLLIFNGLYGGTLTALKTYDKYAYGEQAMSAWAHPGVALFILGGFVLLNLIYLAIEGVFWQSLKEMRPVFHFVLPVASFVGIGVFLLLIMFLRNL